MKETTEVQIAVGDLPVVFNRLAWTVKNFAEVVDLSETTIREEIASSRLISRFPRDSKQLITLVDGLAWARSLPTEKQNAA